MTTVQLVLFGARALRTDKINERIRPLLFVLPIVAFVKKCWSADFFISKTRNDKTV